MIYHYRLARALAESEIEGVQLEWWKPASVTPSGNFTVTARLGRKTPLKLLKDKSDFLAHALRAYDLEIEQLTPRRISITVNRAKVTTFPTYPTPTECRLFPQETRAVPLGLDSNGYQIDLPLFDDAGGQVVILAGSPGTGKSSTLSLITYGLAESNSHIVWFDPKGAADAGRHSDRVEVVRDAINSQSAEATLDQLLSICERRSSAQGEMLSIAMMKSIVVFVDEWATLGMAGDKRSRDSVQHKLRTLTALGRASKITVVLSTQRPTSDNIDVTTRSLASSRICFAVGDKHASIAALGHMGAEELNPRTDRGVALVEMGHGPKRVRIFSIPQDLQSRLVATRGFSTTLSDIARLDEVSLREQRVARGDFQGEN